LSDTLRRWTSRREYLASFAIAQHRTALDGEPASAITDAERAFALGKLQPKVM
jgi:sRNA-binding protein